ncbi:MAG: Asd/ArgC dimerization domain-containing protein [Pseudomonadota bacterium]|nr:Asd/ArgC dimerization domain-containing protein [Pseudomonadota bacterium]
MSDATSHFDLAVLGADDPLGEAVLRLLEEREVAIGKLYPLTLNEVETTVAFAGKDWPCMTEAEFDFNQTQALVVATRAAAARQLAAEALTVRPAMPVIDVAGIDPAPAVVVARVLRVIDAVAGVQSAEAFVALSVAMAGQVGVDELSNQTRGLFNLASPDPEVFPLQIAFNLMPLPDQTYDARLAEATDRLLGKSVEVGYSSIQAPIFFGAAVMLHVRAARAVDLEQLRLALTRSDGITLMESDLPVGIPTPATDAADSDDVFIGRIQATENRLKLWLVFDPLRLEAARIVGVVENWIDKPSNSMLT